MKKHFLCFVVAPLFALIVSSCDTHELNEPGLLVPLTVDEDPSLPSIFVNGTQLHSETFGNPNDPMIVVLHGGPGGDYRSILNCGRLYTDSFFVVFYDQRGSGLSKRHDAGMITTEIFIDDLDAVITFYRISPGQKIILLGHSWGAMLATAYINKYPNRVAGAILIEPGGLTWNDTKKYIEKERTLDVFGESSNDFVYLDQIINGSDHVTLAYKAALQNAADFSKGNRVGNPGPYPFWRFGAVCTKAAFDYVVDHPFDFTTNLSQYTTKVLFVYGELNETYGKTHAEEVAAAYPNVQITEIKGTGHEIPYFGWDNFYPVAKAYLNTIK
ncbi:MAG: alpha/beta hydrolase [Ignavibacteriales bacterium]|nr:alpha/beta hydrolase [Ignavibacteriales bacterium]